MPRQVKAWACSFGCGRRVTVVKKTIEKHEEFCFQNPARRACATCVHWQAGNEVNFCAKGLLPLYDEKNKHSFATADCTGWASSKEPLISAIVEAQNPQTPDTLSTAAQAPS